MLLTYHWSASPPVRLRCYHVEAALKTQLDPNFLHNLRALAAMPTGYNSVPWMRLYSYFNIWKNDTLTTSTEYGTYHLNHDPRDNSPNIEIAAMCMDGAAFDGPNPFTIAHAWVLAGLGARVCLLKGLDPQSGFETTVDPSVLQNGPIFVVSDHGERAIQTVNFGPGIQGASSLALSQEFGYFPGSGDPNSRSDIYVLDKEYLTQGQEETVFWAKSNAAWMRRQTNAIYQQAKAYKGFPGGLLGLDGLESA